VSFNSCTGLSNADLQEYGLDPATKKDATAGLGGLAQGCKWENQDVMVGFTVGPGKIDALKANRSFYSVTPLQIGGRDSARVIIEPAPGICAIGIPSSGEVAAVDLTIKHSALPTAGDPCALVTDIANKFVSKLPK